MPVIARSHRLDPSQLFAWRRKALASGLVAPVSEARVQAAKFARFDAVTSDMMEIVIGNVVVRVGSDVEPERLAAVIRAFGRHDPGRRSGLRGQHPGRLP
ncbi:IS66 family insertion sequence element accessory protein TnpB [Bradyrhizobium sp. U531]|uniref:IS66 family insertion sequence element accessory protein TnpB n=1 Tax=Bradyrhizobium sp. U531 TaxID=3053458 RepID=UPI003F4224A7